RLSGSGDAEALWELARPRIDAWQGQARELAAAANEVLATASPAALEPNISALEADLDALQSRFNAVTGRRFEACAAGGQEFEARFSDAIGAAEAGLESAVGYETETCNIRNQMASAEPPEIARLWQGYGRYAEGRASAGPEAAMAAIQAAETALAELQARLAQS